MSPIRMSYMEEGMRTVIAFNEAFNRQDVQAMLQFTHEDCVLETADPAPRGGKIVGRDEMARFWQEFFRMSPHARKKIEEVFGLGYRCIMRWRYSTAEDGDDETGVRGVDIFQFKEDLIVEMLSYVKGKL